MTSVSANDFVIEDDNNMSVEIQKQGIHCYNCFKLNTYSKLKFFVEMAIIKPNCNYVSAPITPEIENEGKIIDI